LIHSCWVHRHLANLLRNDKEADMKRTALAIPAHTLGILAALALLGGCATDGYYSGGSGYYGGGYYDGYYGPDYYPGYGYGYAYVPRGGYGGGGYRGHGRDHDRGRDYNRGDGQANRGGRGDWNGGNRGNWNGGNGGASQAARDADRAAHPRSFNADGERITRGNFWRQNQSAPSQTMTAPQTAAPSAPSGGGGWRGRRGQ
jgi:hypothetical protein